MADEENLYLDNLEEFIRDQDKIVTYKWLSRTLSVSSNTAKQMLFAFLSKEKEKNSNSLTATYLVGGKCMVDDQLLHQCVLTSEDKLEEAKKQFEVITSVHVYSLQKKAPKDINTLYTVDYEIQQEHKDESNKWSHIYCKEAKKLSDGGARRGCSKGKPGKENAAPKSPEMTNGLGSSSSIADKPKPKPSNQRAEKGQLPSMGMFAVKTEKHPEQSKYDAPASKRDSDKKEKTAKQVDKSKSSGMMSFFGKKISEPSKSTPEAKEEPKEGPKAREESKENSEQKKTHDVQDIKETPESKQKSNKPAKQTRKRIKNLVSSDEEEDPIPKSLKKLVSDSESEEDIKPKRPKGKLKQENTKEAEKKKTNKKEKEKKEKETTQNESEGKNRKTNRKRKKDEKEESSEEDSIKSKSNTTVVSETPTPSQKPANSSTKRRKRRKVMRSKTYVDDDGFMVTEKVYESESTDASDEDEITETKQDPLPAPLSAKDTSPDSKPKKQMDLKPVKQASLTSFFKKD